MHIDFDFRMISGERKKHGSTSYALHLKANSVGTTHGPWHCSQIERSNETPDGVPSVTINGGNVRSDGLGAEASVGRGVTEQGPRGQGAGPPRSSAPWKGVTSICWPFHGQGRAAARRAPDGPAVLRKFRCNKNHPSTRLKVLWPKNPSQETWDWGGGAISSLEPILLSIKLVSTLSKGNKNTLDYRI